MTPNLWINNFTVTDAQRHKAGYTIYKITSIVFPRSVPQALTCLTVWKRFHDIKRLTREMTRRHKSLNLPGHLPPEPADSFFKRFDAAIIRRRKEYILQLLDFVGEHPALCRCHAFEQFFSDSAASSPSDISPYKQCKLDLPSLNLEAASNNQKDITNAKSVAANEEKGADDLFAVKELLEEGLGIEVAPVVVEKPRKDYTRFLTSIGNDDSDYIYEAALEFSRAVQSEANLEYKEAHVRYKRGVKALLRGSKDDSNDDRKFIANAKIAKYLARADEIYDSFLRDTTEGNNSAASMIKSNFQLSIDITDGCDAGSSNLRSHDIERPWNHLAKYKVMQVLGDRVLQVTDPQQPSYTYVMKGVEKPSSNSPTQSVFLPQHVPYMVELIQFFQSDQKIFLLLQQAAGGPLCEYVRSYTPTMGRRTMDDIAGLFPDVDDLSVSKAETDADLSKTEEEEQNQILVAPTESTEFSELVRSSQKLLQSVVNTLKAVQDVAEEKTSPKFKTAYSSLSATATIQSSALRIPEASLKQWARELVVAINNLHCKGVILGDLHVENLLLGAKGQLLLTYFYQHEGASSSCAENYTQTTYSPLALSGHFVAPERPLTLKSDWWSYGVVLYQLLFDVSFKAAHPGHIEVYGCVQFPENCELSENARDLLVNLLQQAPEQRFDIDQIREHAFFSGTNWMEVEQNGTITKS